MKNTPKYIDSNPCDIDWDKMKPEEGGSKRFCSSCSEFVHDLTNVDLLAIDQNELKGKCISINQSQLQDLMFLHPLKRFAAAIFIVFGSSLFFIPESYAQEKREVNINELSFEFIGKAIDKKGNPISSAKVYLENYDNLLYETTTNDNGLFLIKTKSSDYRYIEITQGNKKAKFYLHNNKERTSYDLGEITLLKKKKRRKR